MATIVVIVLSSVTVVLADTISVVRAFALVPLAVERVIWIAPRARSLVNVNAPSVDTVRLCTRAVRNAIAIYDALVFDSSYSVKWLVQKNEKNISSAFCCVFGAYLLLRFESLT